MTKEDKIKIKRVLFTFFTSLLVIPIWWFLLNWIFVPKDYMSDGPTDFAYGFLFTITIPILWGISLIAILILSNRIFK